VEAGLSLERIKEVLLQTAIYAGVPAANTAFQRMGELIPGSMTSREAAR
jgi:3-oxoadipate enol-lactonase/4-carboxymuconolactone decarboxylase